jgi:hypothetical protein
MPTRKKQCPDCPALIATRFKRCGPCSDVHRRKLKADAERKRLKRKRRADETDGREQRMEERASILSEMMRGRG